jgi:hypothetical protein
MAAIVTLIRSWCILAIMLLFAAGCTDDAALPSSAGPNDPSQPTNGANDDDDDDDDDDGDDDDDNDDDDGGDDDPDFLVARDDAPPLATTQVSFYAVRGQEREARIMYRPEPGAADSSEFVHFVVGAGSLVEGPGGTPIAEGDSLQITLTVVDTQSLIVDFQPAGLRFAPGSPAKATYSYGETEGDLDGDGDVDAEDEAIESTFAIWRQQAAGEPYTAIPSTVDTAAEQVTADIGGFTRYAVAY